MRRNENNRAESRHLLIFVPAIKTQIISAQFNMLIKQFKRLSRNYCIGTKEKQRYC